MPDPTLHMAGWTDLSTDPVTTLCGREAGMRLACTDDAFKVTCKSCIRVIEADLPGDED